MSIPITLTPSSLAPNPCYATEQARLNDYVLHIQAESPATATTVIVSQTSPGSDDRDKVWIKVDGSGRYQGTYLFSNGEWQTEVPIPTVQLAGLIIDYYGVIGSIVAPYYVCNGQTITGATTGNVLVVPNLSGRVTIGAGTAVTGTNFPQGALGGEETHTLDKSEMPAHNHSTNFRTEPQSGSNTQCLTAATVNTNASLGTSIEGGGAPHNNLPPYAALYKVIFWP